MLASLANAPLAASNGSFLIKPSIGLILCKTKNRIIAEYALRNTATPMGISEFRHLAKLPEQLKGTLPTIEEIEAELGKLEEPSDGESKP